LQVFLGLYKGAVVAIKRLNCNSLSGRKLSLFQCEVGILATVRHSCILEFIGATDSEPFCIVTAGCRTGRCSQRTTIALNVARGMQFLHSRHIIHLDLKSLNIVLYEECGGRICDFGLSRRLDENALLTQDVRTRY
jgi:serine/threonine protein kinase